MLSSSLNRRSPKRKDVSDEDLFHAVEDVLPYIRIKQVLPKDSVVLQMAYHRNLFQKPFPLDVALGDNHNISSSNWLPPRRSRKNDDYTRPRMFNPYFEETKVISISLYRVNILLTNFNGLFGLYCCICDEKKSQYTVFRTILTND